MLSKLLWLLAVACVPAAVPQSDGAPAGVPAKETLHYKIEWRLVTAGHATLEWNPASRLRAAWQINLHVESAGLVSKLYKVDDNYSALLSPALCVESTHSITHEGSRQRETSITFDSEARRASYLEKDRARNAVILSKETEIPPCVHDVIGGLFYLRDHAPELGQTIMVPVSDGKKSVMAKVEAQQAEDIKMPSGTYKTVRYEIHLFNGALYKRSGHLYVWLTDDRRRLPVQIRVRLQFTIGTINLQLESGE